MTYTHPKSGEPISGIRLAPGTRVRATDRYDSTDGSWAPVPCPDTEIRPGCNTIIVRPAEHISQGHMWGMSPDFDVFAHNAAYS